MSALRGQGWQGKSLLRAFAGSFVGPDERAGGDAQGFAEAADHGQAQRALAVEHFRNPAAAADEGFQRLAIQAERLHAVADRLNRVRFLNGVVLFLPRLYERGKHVEVIAFRGVWLRVHQAVDGGQRRLVVVFGSDRFNVHGNRLTPGSRQSGRRPRGCPRSGCKPGGRGS